WDNAAQGQIHSSARCWQEAHLQVIAQLNEKLLDLHQRVDLFDIGLDDGDHHVSSLKLLDRPLKTTFHISLEVWLSLRRPIRRLVRLLNEK
ncbi:hypothetical protein, partial [Shinella kummerowiae]|uniref:hypothetical protein n=1 Tax=Shinella kummerowiae TaxID=417745 RepID=UPI001AEE27F8